MGILCAIPTNWYSCVAQKFSPVLIWTHYNASLLGTWNTLLHLPGQNCQIFLLLRLLRSGISKYT